MGDPKEEKKGDEKMPSPGFEDLNRFSELTSQVCSGNMSGQVWEEPGGERSDPGW